MEDADRALEDAIGALLDRRAPGATICPSEAARRVDPEGRRELVPDARRVAGRLVADGRIEMTQRGGVVDPGTARARCACDAPWSDAVERRGRRSRS